MVALIVFAAQIGPNQSETDRRLVDLQLQVREQAVRADRADDVRRDGLQRLAKVEEAIAGFKDGFAVLNSKIDRLLFERRR